MSAEAIEAEIQAKGLTAPRVTPADIEAAIAGIYYFTAQNGADGARIERRGHLAGYGDMHEELRLLTFCVLILRNGFTVTGQSACASPENFDAELGRKIARQDAIRQVWPLLGYELRSKLAARPADYRDRVRLERAELEERYQALTTFLQGERFKSLPAAEQKRMHEQAEAMYAYSAVLQERIEAWSAP